MCTPVYVFQSLEGQFGCKWLWLRLMCSVQLVSSAAGRPTGTAFVKFASPHDSMQAMSKDRQHFGARYVELFPSNEDEASAAAAGQTTAY